MDGLKLSRIIDSWRTTPYKQSTSEKGFGASCVGFVFGVVKEYLEDPLDLPCLSANDQRQVSLLMGHAVRNWGYEERKEIKTVVCLCPGDILLTSYNRRHHILLVVKPPVAWHTVEDGGVCPSSAHDFFPCRVYRRCT